MPARRGARSLKKAEPNFAQPFGSSRVPQRCTKLPVSELLLVIEGRCPTLQPPDAALVKAPLRIAGLLFCGRDALGGSALPLYREFLPPHNLRPA